MFPPNLYENKGYFSWRNPLTGETFGIGSNRAQAFDEAIEANIRIAKMLGKPRLADRITGDRTRTVEAWELKYREILQGHSITPATRSNYLAHSRRVVGLFGSRPIRSLTVVEVSEAIDNLVSQGLAGVAKAVRAYMKLSFGAAQSKGWIDSVPIRESRIPIKTVVKRSRLSLEVFMKVYEKAPTEWLRNAMALALVSGQRREDVARAQFKDFRDGGWWLTQASEKTDHPHRIFIPNELKPKGFHLSLGQVVHQCRRTRVLSGYLVHQTERRRGRSSPGRAIRLSTVSRVFTDTIAALGADFGDKTAPTFHEIRSLSKRLYEAQGIDTQKLLGHTRPETAALYGNSRGLEWVKITV